MEHHSKGLILSHPPAVSGWANFRVLPPGMFWYCIFVLPACVSVYLLQLFPSISLPHTGATTYVW